MASIVEQFAQFREKKDRLRSIVQSESRGAAFTPVSPKTLERPSVYEVEEIKRILMEDEEFKGFVTPSPYFFGNGAGVSPSRVAGLEGRLLSLEASGSSASINYLSITDSGTTTYNEELKTGINIIGVNADGPVTVRLPDNLTQGTIVNVKDESLSAGTNNITIETYTV